MVGGGGAPFQNYRKDADVWQVGASIMHVPSGLCALWLVAERAEQRHAVDTATGFNLNNWPFRHNSAANENDVWFVKAGIKRTWMPAGATVLFGEWGQYNDMFTGLCGLPGATRQHSADRNGFSPPTFRRLVHSGPFKGVAMTELHS